MPAIRKIRIVNFRFNDGAKLIPDEIFCTENAEGKPIDTLLNLDNGGGKSVLVQLMLQPVCPKAKVQNRNISDYFQKGTDHAFVLIEWALDNSKNSLLTGIALAASTNADDETESKTIRYYTFLHDYTRTGDKLDIINLPLTERTGSHIRALSFEDMRKFLQSRKVEYFPSDSLRRYQDRLASYGILHTEWENILVRINSVEGGITKFFEEYKTADRLLDRFIIPGVMPDDKDSSEAMEEMFLNYAKSYAGQEENLRLQSLIIKFTDKLQEMLPYMRSMWEAEDGRIQAIRNLADHLCTLEHNIRRNTDEKERLEAETHALKEKLHHIQTEKASEAYYLAKDNYDKADEQLAAASQKKEAAKIRRDDFARQVNVLNAAKEYSDLTAQQVQEKALYVQLRELEQGSMDAHMLSLRYSLYLAASELKKQADEEFQREEELICRYNNVLKTIMQTISELKQKLSDETENRNKATGRKELLLEQIDEGLNGLGVLITVMLDGRYSAEDISNIRTDYSNKMSEAVNALKACENEEQQLDRELKDQDKKRTELIRQQAELNIELQKIKNSLNQYREAYKGVMKVMEHLSLPAESLFSDEPLFCLDRETGQLQEQLKKEERSAELFSEQLKCIDNGQLHLSKTAVSFLQETGVSFQTGEYYLLKQSVGIREKILAVNPIAAYAIIVDSEREQKKLLDRTSDTWLSSVVPVYTLSEFADMAEENWNEKMQFLSAYEKEYFSDTTAYSERIHKEYENSQTKIQDIKHRLDEWEAERNVLVQFSYSADDEQQMLDKIDFYNENLTGLKNKSADLDNRYNEIQSRKTDLKTLHDEQQKKLHTIEQNSSSFEDICVSIEQYENLCRSIAGYETSCKQLSDSIEQKQAENNQTAELIHGSKTKIQALEEHLDKYQKLIEELKDSPEAELLSDEYSTMLEEYRLFQRQRSSDKQSLQEQIEDVQKAIRKIKSSLERFGLEPEEYEKTIYSDAAYRYAEKQYRQAKEEEDLDAGAYEKAISEFATAETRLEQAKGHLRELNTGLLERSEVGSDFERRIKECKNALMSVEEDHHNCQKLLDELNGKQKYAANFAGRFKEKMVGYMPKILENIADTDTIRDEIEKRIDELRRSEEAAKKYHRDELEPFRNEHSIFIGTLDGIGAVIGNTQISGDKYFTLYERTEDDIRRYRTRIGQLAVVLKDVEDSRKQLVEHCRQRVGRLYENLTMLSKKSGIQIGSTQKKMIRVELPEIDETSELLAERIGQYIKEQVKKYLSEQEISSQNRRNHLEIRRLLNCYIGKETIPVKVFKIDKNMQNSSYRSWEDALKANSGGEQFVVLFSLVAAVMNYTRGMTNSLNYSSGVLILDNPFGPISSPHLLEPMFRIAHHFHIQLICLTHLGTAAVTSCFDMVYQLRFRNLPLSNVEILESEAKQHMEHAYYLSEQLSIF